MTLIFMIYASGFLNPVKAQEILPDESVLHPEVSCENGKLLIGSGAGYNLAELNDPTQVALIEKALSDSRNRDVSNGEGQLHGSGLDSVWIIKHTNGKKVVEIRTNDGGIEIFPPSKDARVTNPFDRTAVYYHQATSYGPGYSVRLSRVSSWNAGQRTYQIIPGLSFFFTHCIFKSKY